MFDLSSISILPILMLVGKKFLIKQTQGKLIKTDKIVSENIISKHKGIASVVIEYAGSIAGIVYLILTGNYFGAAGFFLYLAELIYSTSKFKNRLNEYSIYENGITYKNTFYSFSKMSIILEKESTIEFHLKDQCFEIEKSGLKIDTMKYKQTQKDSWKY